MIDKPALTRKQIADRYYEKNKTVINARSKAKRDNALTLMKSVRMKQIIFDIPILSKFLQEIPTVQQVTKNINTKNLSNIYRAFNLQSHECLFQYLMKFHMSTIVEKLKVVKQERNPEKYYGQSTVLKFLEAILIVSNFIKNNICNIDLVHTFEAKCRRLNVLSNDMKMDIKLHTMDKNENTDLISFDELLKRVSNKFGTDSKQYLILALYATVHARDDFYLYIRSTYEECLLDKKKNYSTLR